MRLSSLSGDVAQHFSSVVDIILSPAASPAARLSPLIAGGAAAGAASTRAQRVSQLLSAVVPALAIPASADESAAAALALAGCGLLFRRVGALAPHRLGASGGAGVHESEVLQTAHLLRWLLCRSGVATAAGGGSGGGNDSSRSVSWRLPDPARAPVPAGERLHDSALPVAWNVAEVPQARLVVFAARAWMILAAQATVPVPRSLRALLPLAQQPQRPGGCGEDDACATQQAAAAMPASVHPIVALPGMDCAHVFRTAATPAAGGAADATDDLYPGKALLLGPEAARTGRRWLASILWLWEMVEDGQQPPPPAAGEPLA